MIIILQQVGWENIAILQRIIQLLFMATMLANLWLTFQTMNCRRDVANIVILTLQLKTTREKRMKIFENMLCKILRKCKRSLGANGDLLVFARKLKFRQVSGENRAKHSSE